MYLWHLRESVRLPPISWMPIRGSGSREEKELRYACKKSRGRCGNPTRAIVAGGRTPFVNADAVSSDAGPLELARGTRWIRGISRQQSLRWNSLSVTIDTRRRGYG